MEDVESRILQRSTEARATATPDSIDSATAVPIVAAEACRNVLRIIVLSEDMVYSPGVEGLWNVRTCVQRTPSFVLWGRRIVLTRRRQVDHLQSLRLGKPSECHSTLVVPGIAIG